MLPPNHFLRPLEAAGTGGAQKCWGSGAPNPNRHPNHPLCHAVCATAILFEVVAKFCTMATNLLKFFSMGSDGVAFLVGASGIGCAAGRVYTWSGESASGSGLFMAWAVDFWGLFYFFLSTTLLSQHWGSFFFLLPWTDSSTNV